MTSDKQKIKRMRAARTLLPLDVIVPNPDQPRRVIPASAARAILRGKKTAAQVYQQFFNDKDQTPHMKRLKSEVAELAKSIAKEMAARPGSPGLINALTVYPLNAERYMIETGEMRFWAMIALSLAYPDDERHRSAPVEVIKHPSAVRQAVENLHRHSLNAMEMAWSLQRVWDELKRERPLDLVPPSGKKSKGRPREWPTWSVVAERIGLSDSTVALYTPLLELLPEAQSLILAYDIPERRIRYMLAMLPRPKYSRAIGRLLKRATAGERLWSATEFRQAVDKITGGDRQDSASVPRLVKTVVNARTALSQSAHEIRALLGKRPSRTAARRQRTRLIKAKKDQDFQSLVSEAKVLLRYLQALVEAGK